MAFELKIDVQQLREGDIALAVDHSPKQFDLDDEDLAMLKKAYKHSHQCGEWKTDEELVGVFMADNLAQELKDMHRTNREGEYDK